MVLFWMRYLSLQMVMWHQTRTYRQRCDNLSMYAGSTAHQQQQPSNPLKAHFNHVSTWLWVVSVTMRCHNDRDAKSERAARRSLARSCGVGVTNNWSVDNRHKCWRSMMMLSPNHRLWITKNYDQMPQPINETTIINYFYRCSFGDWCLSCSPREAVIRS